MSCPICGSDIQNNVCPLCRLDYETLLIAGKVSGYLYNKGLDAARYNDMSGAIELLTKSIEFDKRNKNALDLLGLCYYNIGKINDALKVWILCFHYNGKQTRAAQYIKLIERDLGELDKMRAAVTEYNKALMFAGRSNDDMAIMSLTKAISFNPRFVDALNLTALCHIYAKKNDLALEYIEQVLMIDKHNATALKYYRAASDANSGRKPVERPSIQVPRTDWTAPGLTTNKQTPMEIQRQTLADKLRISEFVCFIVGLLVAAGFMYFLVFPALNERGRYLDEQTYAELTDEITRLENELFGKEHEINRLNDELDGITQQPESELVTEWQNRAIILDAYIRMLNGQYAEAADLLNTITGEVPPVMLSRFDTIVATTHPGLEADYYNQAQTYFNAGNYTRARQLFERSYRFTSLHSTVGGHNTQHYLARIAVNLGELMTARYHFEHIVETYPATAAAAAATQWLNENLGVSD